MKLSNLSFNNQSLLYPFESEISYIFDSCTLAKRAILIKDQDIWSMIGYRKYRKKTCSYIFFLWFFFSSVAPMTTTSSHLCIFLIVVSHICSHSWRNYATQIPAVLPVCAEKQTRNRKCHFEPAQRRFSLLSYSAFRSAFFGCIKGLWKGGRIDRRNKIR